MLFKLYNPFMNAFTPKTIIIRKKQAEGRFAFSRLQRVYSQKI